MQKSKNTSTKPEHGCSPRKRRVVHFFEDYGKQNTEKVIELSTDRAKERDIEGVVVASVSGETAIKVAQNLKENNVNKKTICVTGPPYWEDDYGFEFPLIEKEDREKLDELGIPIVEDIDEPFRPLEYKNAWKDKTITVERPEADLFWTTLITVGGAGVRTAVEVIFMALEAGEIERVDKVIGIAGTNEGADSAIVMQATKYYDAVGPDPDKRLRIEEILAMPKILNSRTNIETENHEYLL